MSQTPEQGLYEKFRVIRKYSSPKHSNCRYFVLDIDHDPHAIEALSMYAYSCVDEHPQLAKDLRQLIKTKRNELNN